MRIVVKTKSVDILIEEKEKDVDQIKNTALHFRGNFVICKILSRHNSLCDYVSIKRQRTLGSIAFRNKYILRFFVRVINCVRFFKSVNSI